MYNTIQYNTIQYNTIQYNTITFVCSLLSCVLLCVLSVALTWNTALYKLFLISNIVSALQYKAPRLKGQTIGSGYGQGRTVSETTAVMADQGYGRSSDRSGVYIGVN